MLRIALCDDDRDQLSILESMLHEYSVSHPGLDLRLHKFLSASALMEHLRLNGCFDIYLLDILMPEVNGIELGLNIRKADPCGHIFYLTYSPDYAVDSYLTKASQYLLKPIKQVSLFAALDETVNTWISDHQAFITVKTRMGLQRVSIRDLVFGELVGHCVHYHLVNGTVLEGMSLRVSFRHAVSPLLEHHRFVLCSASFVVNLAYVDRIDASGLRLVGDSCVPLSRSLRTEVTNRWLDYHLKGGQSSC